MAAGSTYTPIATTTITSNTSTITFGSIPSTYTDLVLQGSINLATTGGQLRFYFNGTTGTTNYSSTNLRGTGTAAESGRTSNGATVLVSYSDPNSMNSFALNIFNYANTTTFKTILARNSNTNYATEAAVGLWRQTSAISSITLVCGDANFSTGTTLTLYGIASA